MINFNYTDSQKEMYQSIVAFAHAELNANVIARDKNQQFAREEWKKCGVKKLHGLCVPLKYGGLGLDAVSTAIALEALSFGCMDGGLVFGLAAQLLSCTIPVYLHGTEEQKNTYLPGIISGKIIVANAMTESGSGSDAFTLATHALKEKDIYHITGGKTFISNAPNSDYTLLYAATNPEKGFYGGITAFLTDSKMKGISCSSPIDKMGLRSCLMGTLTFKDLQLNASHLLGKEGAGAIIFSESMYWERALLGAIHIGTMKRILQQCIEYINSRKIKEEPIGKNQALAHRIAEMHTLVETSVLLIHKAAHQIDHKAEDVAISSSTAKLFVSESLNKICDLALTILGGNGYTTDLNIERYKRDAVASQIYSGTNDIQKNIIAKWLSV